MVGDNEGDHNHNARLGSQIINKLKKLKYLGLIKQKNGEIVKDLTNKIIYSWMM